MESKTAKHAKDFAVLALAAGVLTWLGNYQFQTKIAASEMQGAIERQAENIARVAATLDKLQDKQAASDDINTKQTERLATVAEVVKDLQENSRANRESIITLQNGDAFVKQTLSELKATVARIEDERKKDR